MYTDYCFIIFRPETKKTNKIIEQRLLQEKQIEEEAEKKIYLMGKFDPAQREDFVPILEEYNIAGYKIYLRKETLNAFLKMASVADKDEIDLKIISATRNFDYQNSIWNKKWTGVTLVNEKNLAKNIPDGLKRFKKILEYSAVSGASRHHWGTDIDINNANPEYFKTKKGKEVYEWLAKNAKDFGFCQPYTLKDNTRPTGHNEEKWHWSYLPLAKTFTQEYKNLITDADIKGFDGDEYVSNFNLINDYALGINPDCL